MAQRVLMRRDEYYEKKQSGKVTRSTVSAIVAASVTAVIILIGTIIGGAMKKNVLPAAVGEASDDMTGDTVSDAMAETDTAEDITDGVYRRKLASLLKIQRDHPDAFGWISVPGTVIDNIVMQSKDSNNEYLYKEYNGNYTRYGSVFADWRNKRNILENRNTVLYGQIAEKTGMMFTPLKDIAENEDTFQNQTVDIITADGIFTYEIFSVYYSGAVNILADKIETDFFNDQEFLDFCESCKNKSLYEKNAEFAADGRILTLVSYTYARDEKNVIVHAFLKEVEVVPVDMITQDTGA
ncbi:MAG: class B sortase [Clostridia bacterium]|nr:class B sortase [Clostridia bacterium]